MAAMKPSWKRIAGSALLLTPLLMLATGCAKHLQAQIPITAVAIPCRDVKAIDFAAPDHPGEPDPDNSIDTTETIDQIRDYNAAYGAVCERAK